MRRSLIHARALGTFVLFGLVPLGVVIGAWLLQELAQQRLETARRDARESSEIVRTIQGLEVALGEAEGSQRGYLLTDDPSYLAPYDDALRAIQTSLAKLRDLLSKRPDELARLSPVETSVGTKLGEMAATILSAKSGNRSQALAIFGTDVGEYAMRHIMGSLDGLLAAEDALRVARADAASEAMQSDELAARIGAVIAVLALGVVATVIYRLQRRSLESEETLQETLESVREGVVTFDAAHRLIAWNRLFEEMFRIPAGLLRRGMPVSELEAAERARGDSVIVDLQELDQQSRRNNRPVLVERSRQDGSIIELYHSPTGDGFVTTSIDVTERHQAEAFLRQAQRMEALGQMTGGIAHDFNNLLTVVIGNLDRLESLVSDNARRLVDQAMRGAERGAALTQQLLAYARRQPLAPRPVDVAALLPDMVDILCRTIGEAVEIEPITVAGLWPAMVDPSQFELALINLALNARDAMPDGGKLTLELCNMFIDEVYAERHGDLTPGQYVMLAVTDTGVGMPPEVAARAFDPFFTTKIDGKGTGLGLSMVYGFAKQSGGHVKIFSEAGLGTTIRLYLPRSIEAAEPRDLGARRHGDFNGEETVLVVEDDGEVRRAVVGMTAELGYRVLEAEDGVSALEIIEAGEPVDLLFTDVVMPGPVGGRALAEAARRILPELKILFTSGYTEDAIVHHGRLDPGVNLLSKPYRREDLARRLRAALDEPHPDSPLARQASG